MNLIYLAAGHGGSDPGAVHGDHVEKVYTLDIALKAAEFLRAAGHSVMMNRTDDRDSFINDRCKAANEANAAVFVEIHINAGGGTGCEVYHSKVGGDGQILAVRICEHLAELGYRSRGPKIRLNDKGEDYFGVIRQTNMPALLVECCFIDNQDDMNRLNTSKMAEAVVAGILEVYPAELPTLAPAPAPSKKSNDAIAAEVIAGKWGNGAERKKKLLAAGYDYDAVQKLVNQKLKAPAKPALAPAKPKTSSGKTNSAIADEVIAGKWGNGAARKKKLEAAGYNYSAIQRLVNQKLKK